MPETGSSYKLSFDPVWPPTDGEIPLWLRTAAQEAFGDVNNAAPRQVKSEIFKGNDVRRVFEQLKSSRDSWTEPEFIEAVLADKRWKRLMLEHLEQQGPDQGFGFGKVAECVKNLKETADKLNDLLEKIKKVPNVFNGVLKPVGSTAIVAGTGVAVLIVIGYIFWLATLRIRFNFEKNMAQPISIPISIQPTIRPKIDLSSIEAKLQASIPFTVQPVVKVEKTDTSANELKIPIIVKSTPDISTPTPYTRRVLQKFKSVLADIIIVFQPVSDCNQLERAANLFGFPR